MTATEAVRNFSELLDVVEHRRGKFLVVRNGIPVAQIGPVKDAFGKALKSILAKSEPDDEWRGELRSLKGESTGASD